MIKFVLYFLLASTILFANNSIIEGSGVENIKKEEFENISKFNIEVSIDTTIIKSKRNYYELIGDDNIIDKIQVSSLNGELTFKTDKSYSTKRALKLAIYSNAISSISVSGSMDLDLKLLKEINLYIVASGTIDISVSEESVVKNLSIITDGTVDIDFKHLRSTNTKLDLSGVGEVFLNSISKPNVNTDGIYDITNLYKRTKTDIKNTNLSTISIKKSNKKVTISKNIHPLKERKNIFTNNMKEKYIKLSGYILSNDFVKFKNTLGSDNINIFNVYSPTLLYQASIDNRLDFVKLLFNNNVLINYKTSEYNETALHGAIRAGKMAIVFFLANNSENLNIKNAQGQTVLHLATLRGMNSIINLLLNKGANKRIKNNNRQTAYDIAQTMLEIDKNTLARLKFIKIDEIEKNKKITDTNIGVYIGK